MAALEFRVLGALEVRDNGTSLTLGTPRTRTVLGILLSRPNQVASVDLLVDELWPSDPPGGARAQVHDYISRLRRSLREGPSGKTAATRVVTRKPGYLIEVEPGELDRDRFEDALSAARNAEDPDKALRHYGEAHRHWRGDPFSEIPQTDAITAAATSLLEQRLASLEERHSIALEQGIGQESIPELTDLAVANPLREGLIAILMRALYQVGRTAEALEVGRRTKERLAEELGVDPGPDLRRTELAILRGEPATAPAPRPAPARTTPAQLPPDLATFTGRDAELAQLLDQTGRHDSAIAITAIDGMAGIGKTALAVHAAHLLADRFPDGQIFVDLHGYTQGMRPVAATEALERILRDLGIFGDQIPVDLEERAALYRSRLADRRMLIVLDNAAAEAQIAPLLPGAPGSLVIITSRIRPTGLDHVRTLSLDSLPTTDAIELFADLITDSRIASASPDLLAETVELCGRLPLAIRLAAARLQSHPSWAVEHLAERLRDQRHRLAELEAGQHSVTAALDLSYRQLCQEAQRTYRLLGLLPGADFDAHATAALTGSTVADAQRLLDQLLEAHVLQEPTPGRYVFHDLTRAHSRAMGDRHETEAGRLDAVTRLLDYYRNAVKSAMDTVYPFEADRRPDAPESEARVPDWSDLTQAGLWLDTELPNLLAAAECAVGIGRSEYTVDFSASLHEHLRSSGRYAAAERLHRQALEAAAATDDAVGQLDAMVALGYVCRRQGRFEEAVELFAQAIGIARASGCRTREVSATVGLGHVRRLQGQFERAAELFERAIEMARGTGSHARELSAVIGLGHVRRFQGRLDSAGALLSRAIETARLTGNRARELRARFGLGHVRWLQGRHELAAELFEQGADLARATGDVIGEITSLIGFGYVYQESGANDRASESYRQALKMAKEINNRNWQFEAMRGLGRLHQSSGEPEEALAWHRAALELATELAQPHDAARAHHGLAHAHRMLGRLSEAREHWSTALEILAELGTDHTEEGPTADRIRACLAELDRESDEVRTPELPSGA